MKRISLVPMLLLLGVSVFGVAGCSDPYGTAAKLAQDVAVSVNQASTTVDQFRVNGTVSAAEERSIIGYLNTVNSLDGQYIACVQVAHGSTIAGGFTKCVQSLLSGMTDPANQSALHVTNPQSQAKVTAIVQGIEALVNATSTALGGK